MDRVSLSHIIQLGEFGCLPRDILARKHEKNSLGIYKGTHDYYPFDAKLGDIVFDLVGVGGNPTAMARTMLAWWQPRDWTTLHGRIFKCMHDMFRDHKKLANLLAGMQKKSKSMTEIAILVLTHVEERNPDKQKLVVEILGAKYVCYHPESNDPPETFTRTCIFGNQLRSNGLVPEIAKLGIKESDLEDINIQYREKIRIADLKKRQLTVLQTFLERFVKLNSTEFYHVIRTLEEKTINGLWRHCKDIRDGKIRSDFWSHCRDQLITALFEGCTNTDGICGSCWVKSCPKEEVGVSIKCLRHPKVDANPQVLPSAPPLERSATIVGLEEQLKQAPPQDIPTVEPSAPLKESQDEMQRACPVCFEPFNCVLVPCGHISCISCSEQLKVCPICRGDIIFVRRFTFDIQNAILIWIQFIPSFVLLGESCFQCSLP